jgi:hypothetical protein
MDSTQSTESNAPSSYIYSKLDHVCEIRLLKLLPGIARLECELDHVKLSEAPPYEAVSYCWGAPDFTENLHCGRGFLKITRNLHSALTTFRLENAARYLWVDAVCIYPDRSRIRHLINLRFKPLFCEGLIYNQEPDCDPEEA